MLKLKKRPIFIQHVGGTVFTTKQIIMEYEWHILQWEGTNCDGTWYQHKDFHKVTWRSPDNKICNQVDHIRILVDRRHCTNVCDVRSMRAAEI